MTLPFVAARFVALGDSFTEGVGDWNSRFPHGVRGWADRVAKQLSKREPSWEYANLALRSLVLDDIVEQWPEPIRPADGMKRLARRMTQQGKGL